MTGLLESEVSRTQRPKKHQKAFFWFLFSAESLGYSPGTCNSEIVKLEFVLVATPGMGLL